MIRSYADRVEIESSYSMKVIVLPIAFMLGVGIFLIVNMAINISEDLAPGADRSNLIWNVFGLVFSTVWTAVLSAVSVGVFLHYAEKAVISDDGITVFRIFGKKHLGWNGVAEYGIKNFGPERGEINTSSPFGNSFTHVVWFSKKIGRMSRKGLKYIPLGSCQLMVRGSDNIYLFKEYVVPLCSKHTDAAPCVNRYIWSERYNGGDGR